jgi:hypothetical protein
MMNANESSLPRDEHPLMTALGRGFPITLLVDLVDPNGPRSLEMFDREGLRRDAAGQSTIGIDRVGRSTYGRAARTA